MKLIYQYRRRQAVDPHDSVWSVYQFDWIAFANHSLGEHGAINAGHSFVSLRDLF